MTQAKKRFFSQVAELIKATYSSWRNDRTLRLGAGLAYYVVFSLIPILAVSVYVASVLFPKEEVVNYLRERAIDLFGATATEITDWLSQQAVTESIDQTFNSLGIFGLAALVVTASFAIIALNDSVSMIWGQPVRRGFNNMVKRYLFSYVMVLGFALILIVVLTVQAVLRNLENIFNLDGPLVDILTSGVTRVVSWTLLVLALALLMRVLTVKKVSLKHSLIGSAVTILFMYLGVIAIGFYINNFTFNSVTSAFSAVLLVLVWVYYESQILLAGFQLTKTLSQGKYFEN